MIQGFYRESQGRSKSITHYVMRLEGKLNKIWVKHPNQVSEVETAEYIWDCLFYGLRKPLQEAVHAKFDNPLNHYMALKRVGRKAKSEHEQEKHNSSCISKAGVVSKGLPIWERSADPDSEALTQEPWSKWVEMQQQLMAAVKGGPKHTKRNPQQGAHQIQRRNG